MFCKKSSRNLQENTCARVFFNKVAYLRPETLLKKRLWQRCFPVNFTNFSEHFFYRTPLGDFFWYLSKSWRWSLSDRWEYFANCDSHMFFSSKYWTSFNLVKCLLNTSFMPYNMIWVFWYIYTVLKMCSFNLFFLSFLILNILGN